VCSKQFPSALFLISILRAGDAWAGYGAVALPCGDGTYVIVESCISAGPSDDEEEILAELQPVALQRGYGPSLLALFQALVVTP
jgi:hypothetical protein